MKQLYKHCFTSLWVILLLSALLDNNALAQNSLDPPYCEPSVPVFDVDFTGQRGGEWFSPNIRREGGCCGVNTGPPDNDRCVSFIVTLDSNSVGLKFEIHSGAVPPGALYLKIDCGPEQPAGAPICLAPGTYKLTFCKPGANRNIYKITAIGKPEVSPNIVVSDGCRGFIYTSGFDPDRPITWTSVAPGTTGQYNSYLNTTTGPSVMVTAPSTGIPQEVVNHNSSITYRVTGYPLGGCNTPVSLEGTVHFVSDKRVEILPKDPVICFGGTGATITANGSGGGGQYTYLWSTGETTQSITVGAGTYSVRMLDQYTHCPPVYDTVVVHVNPNPIEANAGPDLVSCTNQPAVQLQGSVTMARGGTWTGGTGTFSPNRDSLNAIYTPSQAEINAGSVTLTLTTTGNGPCPAMSDQMVIDIVPAPIVNAGPNQAYCANNTSIQLNGRITTVTSVAPTGAWMGGAGSFYPNRNALDAIYTPTAAEVSSGSLTLTLSSTDSTYCNPVTAPVTFTFTPAPLVDAGLDRTVCANSPRATLRGSVTGGSTTGRWIGGGGTFSPSRDSLNVTYNPTVSEIAAGRVTLTLESTNNGLCAPVRDEVVIFITPAPVVNAGPDQPICENNALVQLAGSVVGGGATGRWVGGNGTFSPDRNSLTAVYTPTAAERAAGSSLTLTLESAAENCITVSDQMVITFTAAPTANVGDDKYRCTNNPAVELSAVITGATGGRWIGGTGNFYPDRNTLHATYIPSATELPSSNGQDNIVVLQFETTGNGNCNPVRDTLLIYLTPAPVVNAGTDQELCANNATVTLAGSVTFRGTTATATSVSREWKGGNGTFSPDRNSLNATYTPTAAEIAAGSVALRLEAIKVSNPQCDVVSDEVVIRFTPAPVVSAGPDGAVCGNNATWQLNGSISGGATGGEWTGGTGTFEPSRTSLNATYTPSAEEIAAGSVTLTLNATGIGNCSPVRDSMVIIINPGPTASAMDMASCANNPSVTLRGSVTRATGGIWSGGNGNFLPNRQTLNATYVPTQAEANAGIVQLILTTTGNGDCLPARDTMFVIITPAPVVNAGTDLYVCLNNVHVQLNGNVTYGGSPSPTTPRAWSGGQGSFSSTTISNPTYTPTADELAAGKVSLILTAYRSSCNPVSDTVDVFFTPAPTVNAGPDREICANNATAQLSGSVTIATGGIWSGGNGTFHPSNTDLNATYRPTAEEIAAGQVTLTLTSTGNGTCMPVSDQMVIRITPAPTAYAGIDQSICMNNANVQLDGRVTIATGGVWSGGNGTFTPSSSALNARYLPTAQEIAAGSLRLVLTTTGNNNCLPVRDTMLVSFTPAPTVDAGQDFTICADRPRAQLDGRVTVATGGTWAGGNGSFSPSRNALNAVYTPTAAEIQARTVTLTLVTTGYGTCNPVADDITITIAPAPVVNAGPDQALCGDVSSVSLNGTVSNAAGGTWTTAGSGTFNNANQLNAVYTPSAADKSAGSVTLTLTSTGNGTCLPMISQMEITFSNVPTVYAGPDQTVCSTSYPVQLNGSGTPARWSGGAGTFSPDRNTMNATYRPTAEELSAGFVNLTLTTITNGPCAAVSDQVRINLLPGPVAYAGQDQVFCGDISTISLSGRVENAAGGTWTSSGRGAFSPNASTLNATYAITNEDRTNGSVQFILITNGNNGCLPGRDTIVIRLTPAVTANAGLDQTICADRASIQLNGSVNVATGGTWTSSGSGTFSNSNVLNPTYTPSAADRSAGSVRLILTTTGNGDCRPASDEMVLTINPAPTVDAGPARSICFDADTVRLNGRVTVATGGRWSSNGTGTFSPNEFALDAVYYLSAEDKTRSGGITLTLSSTGNGLCNEVRSTTTITVTPAPTVTVGPNQTVCADANSVQLNGSVTIATGGRWSSNGTGSFSPSDTTLNARYIPSAADKTAGAVTLTLTSTGNGACRPVSRNMVISITPPVAANAGPDHSICADASSVAIQGSVQVASGGRWTTTGSGTFSSATSLSTTYAPSATDKTNGGAWLILTTTGNGLCNPVSDTMRLDITPAPTAYAGPDETVCADNAAIQLAGSVTVATQGRWTSNGTGTFSPNANTLHATYRPSEQDIANGRVILRLTTTDNGTCNPVSDEVQFTITPRVVVLAGRDTTVCADIPGLALSGSVTTATGGRWSSSGSGTFSPSADSLNTTYIPSAADTAAGSVRLTLTSTGNGHCSAASESIIVTITKAPTVRTGPAQTICADQATVTLQGYITVATGGLWTTNGTGTFSPDAQTLNAVYRPSPQDRANGGVTLTLTTTGNGTCNAVSSTTRINIAPTPTVNAGPDMIVCADNSSLALSGTVTNASGGRWSILAGSGYFAPKADTTHTTYVLSDQDKANGSVQLILTSIQGTSCNPTMDTLNISITPSPTAYAGEPITVCADDPVVQLNGQVTLAGGGVWSTNSGQGTFSPNANTLNATFTPTAAQIAAGSVVLTLTTTDNNGCNPVRSTVQVTITPKPIVDAGYDMSVCANNPAGAQLSGSITHATGARWSSSGTGSFAPDRNTLNAIYYPSPADTVRGSVVLTLTSTTGSCTEIKDSITLFITPSPTIDAGPAMVCSYGGEVALQASITVATGVRWTTERSIGGGTFTNPNSLRTNYRPSEAEIQAGYALITVTTTGNGDCVPVSANIRITITPSPAVNAGEDQYICANVPTITLRGSYNTVSEATGVTWTSSGGGRFGNANDTVTTYAVSAADRERGFITLTLTTTGGQCPPGRDEMIVHLLRPVPSADAGPDIIVCSDTAGIAINGTVSIASGGMWSTLGSGTFQSASSLRTTYFPSDADRTAGRVRLVLTTTGNNNCFPETDTLDITLTPAPTVNAGADQTVCSDAVRVAFYATHSAQATGLTWSTAGTGTFEETPDYRNVYYWPSADDIANGFVDIIVTTTGNGMCNPVSDVTRLSFTPAPVVSAGGSNICTTDATIPLNGSFQHASGVVWSVVRGSGSFLDASSATTSYIKHASDVDYVVLVLTATGSDLCTPATDTIMVGLQPGPVADAGTDQQVCATSQVTLQGQVSNAPGGVWTTSGSGTFNLAADGLTGTYLPSSADTLARQVMLTLTTTGTVCPPHSSSITVTFIPAPIVEAGPERICIDENEVQLSGYFANATGVIWTKADGSSTGFDDPTNPVTIYRISQADRDAYTADPTTPIALRLTTTGSPGCDPVTDVVYLNITPAPTVSIVEIDKDDVCANKLETVNLKGTFTIATHTSWTTNNADSQAGFSNRSEGSGTTEISYQVAAADAERGFVTIYLTTEGNGNCNPARDSVVVTISPAPVIDAGPETICSGEESVALNATITPHRPGVSVVWTNAAGSSAGFSNANSLSTHYTPTPQEREALQAIVTVTTIDDNFCNAVSDQVTIYLTPPAVANAGGTRIACEGDTVTLNGSFTHASNAVWTTTAAGTILDAEQASGARYVPAANDTVVVLYLETSGTNPCSFTKDSLVVRFTPRPYAFAGSDTAVCLDVTQIQLSADTANASGLIWTTSGTGTFSDARAPHAIYTFGPGERELGNTVNLTLSTENAAQCSTAENVMVVSFTPRPTVEAGPESICIDEAGVALSGIITGASGGTWTTSGSGMFSPSPNLVNTYYIVSAGDRANYAQGRPIMLYLTSTGNGTCNPVVDSIQINLTPPPSANAGPDKDVCADQSSILLSGSVRGANGGTWSAVQNPAYNSGNGTFTNANSLSLASYTFTREDTAARQVSFVLTTTGNGNCNPATDTMVVYLAPTPVVIAGNDHENICVDAVSIPLNGRVYNASGGSWTTDGTGVFSPSAHSLNTSYRPTEEDKARGSIQLTLTSTGQGDCNPVADVLTIRFTQSPLVVAGPDLTVCATQDSIDLREHASMTGDGSVLWTTTGSGTFAPNDTTLAAIYVPSEADKQDSLVVLTLSGIGCRTDDSNMKLYFIPAPTVAAGFDLEICADDRSIQLHGQASNSSGSTWTHNGTGTITNPEQLITSYTLTDADTLAGRIVFTLTVDGIDQCSAVEDSVVFTIKPAPLAFTDQALSMCADADSIQLNGSVYHADGGFWRSFGSGTFSPHASLLNPVYYPSAADKQRGSVDFTFETISSNGCNEVTASATLSIAPRPIVTVGADTLVCANNALVLVNATMQHASAGAWSSSGSGSFGDAISSQSNSYTPSAEDIAAGMIVLSYTTTEQGECNPVQDQMVVNFSPAPTADAGQPQTVCADAGSIRLRGRVTIAQSGEWQALDGAAGTFMPNANTLETLYHITAEDTSRGFVRFVLTTTGNGNCLAVTDTVTVTITPAPTANAGTTLNICADADFVELNGQVATATGGIWSTSGTGTFSPSASALNALYYPSAADKRAGRVELLLTTTGNGNCNPVSSRVRLNITPMPIINAGEDLIICTDENSVVLNGSRGTATASEWNTSGSGTFSNANNLITSYIPSAADKLAGSVVITLQTTGPGTCKPQADQLVLSIEPSPVINAGPDLTVCADVNGVTVKGTVTRATGGSWSTSGSGSFSDSESLTTVYVPSAADIQAGGVILTLTSTGNGNCNPVQDQMEITITPAPTVVAEAGSLCADETGLPVAGRITVAKGGKWTSLSGGHFSPSPYSLEAYYVPSQADIDAGLATLVLTSEDNGTCNPVTDTLQIIISPLPVAEAYSDQTICRDGEAQIYAKVASGLFYQWHDSLGNAVGDGPVQQVIVHENTFFVLTVTDIKGCSSTDTVRVEVADPPKFSLSSHYCYEEGLQLDANPRNEPYTHGTFTWFRNDTLLTENDISIIATSPGTYVVVYTFGSCSVADTTLVTAPPVLESNNRLVCEGADIVISTSLLPEVTYQWTHNGQPVGENTHTLPVKAISKTEYIVSATDQYGCISYDTIVVDIVPLPAIQLDDAKACMGEVIVLDAKPSNLDAAEATYVWRRNGFVLPDSTSSIEATLGGIYTVTYTLGECSVIDTSIVVFFAPPVTEMEHVVKFCPETEPFATLDAGPGTAYRWLHNDSTTRSIQVDQIGTYYVNVFNEYGCYTLDSVEVQEACKPRLFVPNAFTPNGPRDQTFDIFGAHFKNFKMTIFNRWGEIIFYTEDRNITWDGTYRGEIMPVGVYAWTITYEGTAEEFKGPYKMDGKVTIVR